MIPLIVIRPEPGASATVRAARALGLEAHGFPLFKVEPRVWDAPAPRDFDALLVGSANALRHAGPALAAFRALPVHAVGDATAGAARGAGFRVTTTGSGGLQAVLCEIPAGTRVLRLAGEERISLAPPAGVTLTERVVYGAVPQPAPHALAALLRRAATVALHSAEAARHFAAECDRAGLDRSVIALATIGPRVSEAAGGGWHRVATAAAPAESPLLAAARELCQDHGADDVRPKD
ncbi:MAG: uroporphyrinogen-III synthase [Pseudomonadota bacterium]